MVRLLLRPISLALEPVRFSLLLWEAGLSGAASAVRVARELLDRVETAPPTDAGESVRAARRRAGNGGPPEPEVVTPEAEVEAAAPGARGPEPEVVEPEPEAGELQPEAVGPEPEAVEPESAMVEPEHVDEEPVLVAETAEAGAEDGAGAEVRVEEPWEGYDAMTAADIRRRLGDASGETVATVKLYEAAGKGRASILETADRRMRS
jgi:hypothetical protein